MKGLYRYLSPFSPDQSGAVAVLYELGGIIVILDAGGCAGNICGFDELWLRRAPLGAQTERRVLGGHKGPGCHPRSR